MKYSRHNDIYKKLLVLSNILGYPDPAEIFKFTGESPTNSQLAGWRAGINHKNFRIVSEDVVLSYIDGLIKYAESLQNKK